METSKLEGKTDNKERGKGGFAASANRIFSNRCPAFKASGRQKKFYEKVEAGGPRRGQKKIPTGKGQDLNFASAKTLLPTAERF